MLGLRLSDGEDLVKFVAKECNAKMVEERNLKSVMGKRNSDESVVVLLERSGGGSGGTYGELENRIKGEVSLNACALSNSVANFSTFVVVNMTVYLTPLERSFRRVL